MRTLISIRLSLLSLSALLLSCSLLSPAARGESRPSVARTGDYIAQLAPIAFQDGGAALLPLALLSDLRQRKVSPILQFVLLNHFVDACVTDAKKRYLPRRNDSYQSASSSFQRAVCSLQKCFEQGMLIMALPAGGGGGLNVDGQAAQGSDTTGLILAQAFSRGQDCAGRSGGGIDPALVSALRSGNGTASGALPSLPQR